jgi:hypothetical protein
MRYLRGPGLIRDLSWLLHFGVYNFLHPVRQSRMAAVSRLVLDRAALDGLCHHLGCKFPQL